MENVTVNRIDTHVTNTHLDNAAEQPNAINEVGEDTQGSIPWYIENGLSLIPVRDKSDGNKLAKTPYGATWKDYQVKRMNQSELWELLFKFNTKAIAAVCGKVSGNLECIDIDSKFEPGIDALLMQDIKQLYPHLYPFLRIHRTPSGGYHILYQIKDKDVPGNQKLAGRLKTEEELQADSARGLKKPSKTVNFLETRGEGGYFLLPPSMDYQVHQFNPIPLITWEDRCSLINLCRSYDRIVKVEPTPKPTKKEDGLYSINPFEDFNFKCDPIELMESQGWKYLKENNRFIWFTRPGKSDGVSASFNREKRIFYIFTSSTDLGSERGYNPSSILAELKFNGDKKATYKDLVQNGYGKYNSSVEKSLIERAIRTKKTILPSNVSDYTKDAVVAGIQSKNEKYPFGEFWMFDEKGKIAIPINSVLQVLDGLGYRSYQGKITKVDQQCRVINTRIDDSLNVIVKSLIAYVQEEDALIYEEIINALDEKFSTKAKYIKERINVLDKSLLLRDQAKSVFKCYLDCMIEIKADDVIIHSYDYLAKHNLYILDKNQLPRDYQSEIKPSNLVRDFINNALVYNSYNKKVIGYLGNNYKSETSAHLIIQTEQVASVVDGGGSGKNVTTALINLFNSTYEVDGASAKVDATLVQGWSDEGIIVISDVKRNFPFVALKNAITNTMLCKRLYQNLISIPFKDSPKFVISTNYSYDTGDGGLNRRIRTLEYTNFYSRRGGVDKVHGKMFPQDFTEEDWKGLDVMMIDCIQEYLKADGYIEKVELSESGKYKQLVSKYGDAIIERFEELVDDLIQNIPTGFTHNLRDGINGIGADFLKLSNQARYSIIGILAKERGFDFEVNHRTAYCNATGRGERVYDFSKSVILT